MSNPLNPEVGGGQEFDPTFRPGMSIGESRELVEASLAAGDYEVFKAHVRSCYGQIIDGHAQAVEQGITPHTIPAPIDRVEAQLERVEQRIREGIDQPYAGITITAKDLIEVGGIDTDGGRTAGMPFTNGTGQEFVGADQTGTAFELARFEALGGTYVGENPSVPYGGHIIDPRFANPFNADYENAGSSSGSATALAEGVAHVLITGDGGGSTRGPAAKVGGLGVKPTLMLGTEEVPKTGTWGVNAVPSVMSQEPRDTFEAIDITYGHGIGGPLSEAFDDPNTVFGEEPIRVAFVDTTASKEFAEDDPRLRIIGQKRRAAAEFISNLGRATDSSGRSLFNVVELDRTELGIIDAIVEDASPISEAFTLKSLQGLTNDYKVLQGREDVDQDALERGTPSRIKVVSQAVDTLDYENRFTDSETEFEAGSVDGLIAEAKQKYLHQVEQAGGADIIVDLASIEVPKPRTELADDEAGSEGLFKNVIENGTELTKELVDLLIGRARQAIAGTEFISMMNSFELNAAHLPLTLDTEGAAADRTTEQSEDPLLNSLPSNTPLDISLHVPEADGMVGARKLAGFLSLVHNNVMALDQEAIRSRLLGNAA